MFQASVRLTTLAFLGGLFALTPQWNVRAEDSITTEQYRTPEGVSYGAFGMQLPKNTPAASPDQVVILVDTSASQMGEIREQSIRLTKELLGRLSPETQVSVYAIDVQQTELASFATVSPELVGQVVESLEQRIPAGSTDFAAAIEKAVSVIDSQKSARIAYIGDGMSAAHLISPERLQGIVDQLADQKIPFISYALGAQTDHQLLGLLALRSGGVVLSDVAAAPANEIAEKLSAAIKGSVWYPTRFSASENVTVAPNQPLPLRADRQTIYLGEFDSETPDAVKLSLSDEQQIRFSVSHIPGSNQANGHAALRGLFQRSQQDNGLSVPTAGREILEIAKQEFDSITEKMLAAANVAANKGDLEQSQNLSKAVLAMEPGNVGANKLLHLQPVSFLQEAVPGAGATDDAPVIPGAGQPSVVVPGADLSDRQDAPSGIENDRIQKYKNRSKAAGEKLSLEVEQAIIEARSLASDDPDAAISILKAMQGSVGIAEDIDDEIALALERKLLSVEQQVRAQREQLRNRQIRFQQELAEQEARRRVIEEMELEEDRLKQLIDQVRALLDDGYHGDPAAYAEAEAVAEAAVDLVPFSGVATAAQFTAEAAGQLEDARYLRALRADRFLETLTQVEFSHVPFPDEPPIRYPPAPVWKALTERRSIWKSVDLKDDSAAERRIRAALEEETELQFVDTPLVDAINIIGELHNINIRLDVVTLDDEGISSDEPVNIFISGIRLKSALKIMLEQTPTPVELTWIVEDEVMKITTVLKAEEATETRVYPVTDLVIPPQPLQGGLGGFGGGGIGGQQGGFGGQQGGFGGQQGGGQGFFSIPPAAFPPAKKNQ